MKKQFLILSLFCSASMYVSGQDISYMDGQTDLMKKGNNHLEKGELTKAEKAFEKGLARESADSIQYVSQLARVNQMLGDYQTSEGYYRRAYSQNAGDPEQYAEVLAMNEKYDEAEKVLTELKSKSAVAEKRARGFGDVSYFKSDSEGYLVHQVDFNTKEREVFASRLGEDVVIASSRSKGRSFLRVKDGRDESDFYDLYLISDGEETNMELGKLNQGAFVHIAATGELLVTENYPVSKRNGDRDEKVRLKISSYKQSDEGEWELAYTLPFCNESYSVAHPSFDSTNDILYFSSDMPGGVGGSDIYQVRYSGGEWGSPQLVDQINSEGNELYPFADVVHEELYFVSNGYAGLGGLDVYKTFLTDHSEVYNLGIPVNSAKDDFALVLDASGENGWMASDRDGGVGLDDIYSVSLYIIQIRTRITGDTDNTSVLGGLKIIDRRTNKPVPHEITDDNEVQFEGIKGRSYELIADVDGYEPTTKVITLTPAMDGEVVELPLDTEKAKEEEAEDSPVYYGITFANLSSPLNYEIGRDTIFMVDAIPEEVSEAYAIKNVFFDFNSDEPNAADEAVTKLASIMSDYPQITLEIVSYSDSRGSKAYNTQLAQRRADAIVKRLKSKGIEAKRLETKAIGEEHVYNGCEDGVDCTDAQHANNRRIEFLMKMEE